MSPEKEQRRVWVQRAALAGMALILVAFGIQALRKGAFVDQCSEELVKKASARDREYVKQTVQSPLVVEQLLAAATVELVFVRPVSEDHTRVGLALRQTSTSTRADLLQLILDNRVGTCSFLRDYEAGAFGVP